LIEFMGYSGYFLFMEHRDQNDTRLNKQMILGFLKKQRAHLSNLGIRRIGLFGSYVRNEQNNESDLDFLVEFEKDKKNFRYLMNLADFMEALFGRRVEIVTTEALSPYIGPHIMKQVEYVTE
jgi:predicted nucleotidyltransferase